ncbi:MAG: fimbrillin family protein [Rikenellaceae bacterium]|nr:fimbrillin family protein [Rikenellaceae bacterium]
MLLLIAIISVSCGQEMVERRGEGDSAGGDESRRVGFVMPSERGSVISTASDVAQAGGFTVWAYTHAGNWPTTNVNVLNGTRVTSPDNGITWSTETPLYWATFRSFLSFFAYAPANSATMDGRDADGVPQINYTVDDDPVAQKDLLIAAPMLDRVGPDPVGVNFSHALSRIRFSAIKDVSITEEIRIVGIELQNIYSNGTAALRFPISWTVNTNSAKDYSLTNLSGGGLNDILLTDSDQLLTASNGELFLMPQNLDRSSDVPNIVVSYTTSDGISFGILHTHTITGFPVGGWLPGKTYTYQLHIEYSMIYDTFVLSGLLTAVDEFSTLSDSNWGELTISPSNSGTYTTVPPDPSPGLILGTSIATFNIPQDRPVSDEYSVVITVKGAIPQSTTDGPGDVNTNQFGRTVVAISPANQFYLCWIGIKGNFLQIYSYYQGAALNINGEDTRTGFISRDISSLNLNDEYMNVQVTAGRTTTSPAVPGDTDVYINGVLMWTFQSGSMLITNQLQITVGDLRPGRGLRYRGAAYNFALYNRKLDEINLQEVTQNWDYIRRQLGLP